MPELGLLKNLTDKTQSWGNYEIAPHAVGCVPREVTEVLRTRPTREFQVLDDGEAFQRTEHLPFSPRYR